MYYNSVKDFSNNFKTFSPMWCNVKAYARGPGQAIQAITGQAEGTMVFSTKQQGT